ncbi:MAG: polysaccharide biosynthesis protein, partial [Nitrospinae bacterium]|nr:polysaccharide biosynthesis protein [Nitrospinota bacterium]
SYLINHDEIIPRSIPVIDFFILISLLSITRLAWRLLWESKDLKPANDAASIKVLILGANETGIQLIKHLKQNFPQYFIQGFIDNDTSKVNHTLSGIRVLGKIEDLEITARKLGTSQVLIANPNLPLEALNDIFNTCKKIGLKYKKVASVFDISSKEFHITKISHFQTGDLLGRNPVSLDLASMRSMISGKRVLVTGAGGSIGSELCYQINDFDPSCLIMIDIGENYLYELEMKLRNQDSNSKTHFLLCSILEEEKMGAAFEQFKPQLVFHAAAHKHVPLMEKSIDTAITNNILGTINLLNLSDNYKVEKFVLVSTDKVVKPSSIMGMTKHVAEKYVQHMNNFSSTQFICVRFGNVLGSNGSVAPLFWKQILEGGPITITDPRMERFFMLISEAAQLILQATVLGKGGEVFMLEMGKPVKILDLAKKMIHLAGYIPEVDIKIEFLGSRRGEKLTEEIIDTDEKFLPSSHEKIKILKSKNTPPPNLPELVDVLIQNTHHMTQEELRYELNQMIKSLRTSKQSLS